MDLGVYCECGRCLPVAEDDVGSSLTCPCGRRVIVPLLDEFRDRPFLLSAASLERRVQRMIAEGELPSTDGCIRCGEGRAAQEVNVTLECERYTARAHGGQRFLIFPSLWVGWLWVAWWREEEWVEIRGRDTDVPTPICLCAECRRQFRGPARPVSLLLAALLLAVSGLVGYFDVMAGVGLGAVGLVLLGWQRRRASNRRQRALKGLLRKVPVYRQVLENYPQAVVLVPQEELDSRGVP
jgi:hypothetical protein